MDVLLCLTKSDLASPEPIVALYAPLGVEVVVVGRVEADGELRVDGLDEVRGRLAGRVSVLVGHSGVGKSTLVNALVPDAGRATGAVNDVTGRGRHTSSSAVALRLPRGEGWVVDTPGVRSFGLAHVDPARILDAFPELADVAEERCPRGCTHLADARDCALDVWADEGDAGGEDGAGDDRAARAARVDSLRRLLASRSGGDDRASVQA